MTNASNGPDLAQLRTRAADLLHTHRRLVAGLLAGLAMLTAISALRGGRPREVTIWVAAHDLAGGAPLRASDVAQEQVPASDAPSGVLPGDRSPVGAMLGAPMRRGEPLTDVRLVSPALLAWSGGDQSVAVPVRVSDGPAALALVRAGEHISVIAAGDPADGVAVSAHTVVQDVRVLAVPARPADDGAVLVLVAATPQEASALAEVPPGDRVSIALRR